LNLKNHEIAIQKGLNQCQSQGRLLYIKYNGAKNNSK
jgi:hypothetical protein